MKQWKTIVVAFAMLLGLGATATLPVSDAAAINVFKTCTNKQDTAVCKASKDKADNLAKTITNVMFYILGILAVIMIIAGGIRYTISAGDASKVKAAKDTVLYSVVGLIVALLAWAIVRFVVDRL